MEFFVFLSRPGTLLAIPSSWTLNFCFVTVRIINLNHVSLIIQIHDAKSSFNFPNCKGQVCACFMISSCKSTKVQFKMVSQRYFIPHSQKSLYAFHPISQKFPQCCLWNSSNVWLTLALSCQSSLKNKHKRLKTTPI